MVHTRGFTLLEAMLVVAIIGLLSALAVPSLQGVLQKERAREDMLAVLSLLETGRARAVARSRPAKVEFTDDQTVSLFYPREPYLIGQPGAAATTPWDPAPVKTVRLSRLALTGGTDMAVVFQPYRGAENTAELILEPSIPGDVGALRAVHYRVLRITGNITTELKTP